MTNSNPATPQPSLGKLKKILDLVESLDDLRTTEFEEPQGSGRGRLLRRKRKGRDQLLEILGSISPQALRRFVGQKPNGLIPTPEELSLLAILFHQRIQQNEYFVRGRDLLWLLADSTYELSKQSRLLAEDGTLMSLGALMVYREAEVEEGEILNLHFALDLELFTRLNSGKKPDDASQPKPFTDATEHFLAFSHVIEEVQFRAAKAFEIGLWREVLGEPMETLATLQNRFERAWSSMERRLALTEHGDRFPLIRFRREFGLTDAECVIVVAMLVQEAFAGSSALEPLDLLRLVSSSPRGLLRRRRLLSPHGRLMRHGILQVPDDEGLATPAGDLMLSPWVVEKLLAVHIGPESAIVSDERIEFHDFLAGLNGSDEFYDQL